MVIKHTQLIDTFYASVVLGVAISYSQLYLFHIMLMIVLFLVTVNKKRVLKPTTKHHVFFFVMLIWYTITIAWSINIEYSIKYLYYIIIGLAIVLLSIHHMDSLEKQTRVFKVISFFCILNILFSLLESLTSFRLPISPFSEYVTFFGRDTKFDSSQDISIVSTIMQSPTGFNWNPNNLAATMLIMFPFFLLARNKLKYFGLITIPIVIVMSGSKGVAIALAFCVFSYFVFYNLKRFFWSLLIIPISIFFIATNLSSLQQSNNPKVAEIASTAIALNVFLFEKTEANSSIGSRQELISNGIDALIASYGLGVGGGGSIAVQERQGGVSNHGYLSMHNFWIEILVDAGVLFTLFFLLFYIKITYKLWRIGNHTKEITIKYYSQALSLSLPSFFIAAMSTSTAIYFLPMWLMFGFSIATINNYKRLK